MNVSPGSPFMHVLRLSSLRPAEVGLKLKHRTGAQAHRMLCLTLGCVGCQFGTPNEPDPHKIDGLPSLAGSWINLSLSRSRASSKRTNETPHLELPPMDSSSSPARLQAPARSRGSSNASQRWGILRRALLARSSSRAPGPADSLSPSPHPMSNTCVRLVQTYYR